MQRGGPDQHQACRETTAMGAHLIATYEEDDRNATSTIRPRSCLSCSPVAEREIYIHIHTYIYMCKDIYTHTKREREREMNY